MINFYYYHKERLNMYDEYYTSLSLFSQKELGEGSVHDFSSVIHIIKKDPGRAYLYARYIIKGRWWGAEPWILTNAGSAILYAKDVIKGSWPKLEPLIKFNACHAYYYSYFVIVGRWMEAEPFIMEDPYWWGAYQERFGL